MMDVSETHSASSYQFASCVPSRTETKYIDDMSLNATPNTLQKVLKDETRLRLQFSSYCIERQANGEIHWLNYASTPTFRAKSDE